MGIDRAKCKAVHEEVTDAMKEIATKYGLVWEDSRFSFTGTSIKSKLRFSTVEGVKNELSEMGLTMGMIVTGSDSHMYEVVGTKRGKVLITRGGKRYKCRRPFIVTPKAPQPTLGKLVFTPKAFPGGAK